MRLISSLLVATGLATSGTCYADELRPIEAKSIHLKDVNGTAYYTVGSDGYQLVTTVMSGDAATPIRFIADLNPGQTVTISVPGEVGASLAQIEFTRIGDQVIAATSKKVALSN